MGQASSRPLWACFLTAQLLGYSEAGGLAGPAPSTVGLGILLPTAPRLQPHWPLLSPGLASGGTSLLLPQHSGASALLWQHRPVPSSVPDRPPGHIRPERCHLSAPCSPPEPGRRPLPAPPSFPSHPDPLKSLPRPPSPASQPQPNSGLIFSPRPCPSLFQGCPSLPTTALLTALPPNRLPVKTDTACAASAPHPGALVPGTTSSGPAVHWDDARDHQELTRAWQVQGLAQVPGGQARRPPEETSRPHTQEAQGMRSRAEA